MATMGVIGIRKFRHASRGLKHGLEYFSVHCGNAESVMPGVIAAKAEVMLNSAS